MIDLYKVQDYLKNLISNNYQEKFEKKFGKNFYISTMGMGMEPGMLNHVIFINFRGENILDTAQYVIPTNSPEYAYKATEDDLMRDLSEWVRTV